MHNTNTNSLIKATIEAEPNMRSKLLERGIDKLAEALTDASYLTLDLFHYPETDKKARAYRKIIMDAENALANERMKK